MELGVFTPLFNELTFEEMVKEVSNKGLDAVEIGTGGNPGTAHIDPKKLLRDETARNKYLETLAEHNLKISAFSTHNNPLSPDLKEAKKADEDLRRSIALAAKMGVPVVNGFSGVAAGNQTDQTVNWPIIPWPTEYADVYKYQWEEKLLPYWTEINKVAEAAGVKIGIELHGGFLAHTPYTMLRLREEAGPAIGCNLDPSHLWWQGIDPVAAIKILGAEDAIVHFHAKDTYLDRDNMNMYGVTDMQAYHKVQTRAWTFRSVGLGHSLEEWSNMMSALRTYGYDYVISIEHEDPLMSVDEGFSRAIANLRSIMLHEKPGDMWWA